MSHRRLPVASARAPTYVVWELTLACDHACTHCGSRAGRRRARELSTAEALLLAEALAAAGAREVVLIGGEAYLHPGFLDVVRRLWALGVRPSLTTGGRGVDGALARSMADAGLYAASVSIDGLGPTHDRMRAREGSFEGALTALQRLREAGIRTASNINLNRLNHRDLEPLYPVLRDQGITAWQVQLTAPLGRAADHPERLLQPWDLLDLVPRVVALKVQAEADGIRLMPGNNLGYFGPEEASLRSATVSGVDHWAGCPAGQKVLGIESDGAVKGCPSLPTDAYVGGRVTEHPLETLWETDALTFGARRGLETLWGFCRTCPYAEVCRGGCTFTAHAFFGRPGNNPYCHFRALQFAKRGLRERLVPVTPAPGRPFDHGRFALVEEPTIDSRLDAEFRRPVSAEPTSARARGSTGPLNRRLDAPDSSPGG